MATVRFAPTVTIEEVVARIAEWRGRATAIRSLPKGITNANYRVDVGDEAFVVRIPGVGTDLLGIDRVNEHHNTRIAAALGLAAPVVHYLPDVQVMVCAFIQGRGLSLADLQAPGIPSRLAATIRHLHGGPRFLTDFSMFRRIDAFAGAAEARAIPLFPDVRARLAAVARIERTLTAQPWSTVPCHNDLLPENWIDDGRQLRIVDYEYSGNNDPAFELGNLCQELVYDDGRVAELCQAYFGTVSVGRLARVKLQMIVSDVGWALWAALQAALSRIEFDFWRYGTERWTRAAARLDGPAIEAWLDAVRCGA